ncbi:LysR family transcriptional regulator [Salinicola rhizosphaerae]|uniref:LysR family transcriptional regulator n=1 Tax=Salinicola rhizosphaerae TaxID=1443141 RepID=A0ABQ3E678_9GAMM|nr:LysR family transcriptional regulator [Salinicola rhizosphaerae]GHB24671.1 LysR family transcriptional regulator [Salinicola rhizosphaerae]
MNRSDLRGVDFKLLVVFETLMQERSVSKAAERLFLGQPATSAALSRLRDVFGDPLLVRTGRQMVPTARAQEIFDALQPALDAISSVLSRTTEFDPATSQAVFRVGFSDDVEFALLPALLKRLRNEAPGIVLVVRRADFHLMPELLNTGEVTVGVGYARQLPANAKQRVLRQAYAKVLRADTRPGSLSLDEYCARPHALVSFDGDLNGYVDDLLAEQNRKRRIVLAVPQFNSLASLLQDTDMVATVPDYAADVLAAQGGLRVDELPLERPPSPMSMVWQSVYDNDPSERWLRSRIRMMFSDED